MNKRLGCAVAIFAALTAITSHAEAPFNFETTPGKLPKVVVPTSYDIQLKPNIEKLTFSGSETVILDVRKSVKTITLNVNTVTIASAKLLKADGKTEQYARITIDPKKETATLAFDTEIPSGQHQIFAEFAGKINEQPRGLYYARYQVEGSGAKKLMLGTNMEPSDARRVFPCWDEPSFRAKFRVRATLPANFTVVSNMPVESEKKTGAEKEVRFAETPPMSSYLIVFCAGELDAIYGEADGTKIGIVTTKGKAGMGRYALESAEKILSSRLSSGCPGRRATGRIMLTNGIERKALEFHKSSQLFIRSHNESLSVPTMCVCSPDRSPVGINR